MLEWVVSSLYMITELFIKALLWVLVQPLRLLPNVETLDSMGFEYFDELLPNIQNFFSYVDLFINWNLIVISLTSLITLHWIIWGVNQAYSLYKLLR